MKHTPLAVAAIALTLAACHSNSPNQKSLDAMALYAARTDIRAAMASANASSTGECKAANAEWLKEYPAPPPGGVIAELLSRPLSQHLAREAQQSDGQLVQLMVMDKAGCLIAADAKTHDLEQSDETKYKETVGAQSKQPLFEGGERLGRGTIDQISQALYDEKGAVLGALTLRWCPVKGGCD